MYTKDMEMNLSKISNITGFSFQSIESEISKLNFKTPPRADIFFQVLGDVLGDSHERILELGVWEGRSSIAWLDNFPQSKIICVDTWLGSWEHFLDTDSYSEFGKSHLKLEAGETHFYKNFLSNMQKNNHSERFVPIINTTQNAFEILSRLDFKFDIIYIDAAHESLPVYIDLMNSYSLLTDQGILVGDDYETWPSVKIAVDQFCEEHNLEVIVGQNTYLILEKLEQNKKQMLVSSLIDRGYKNIKPDRSIQKDSIFLIEQNINLQNQISKICGTLNELQTSHWYSLLIRYSKFKKFLLGVRKFKAPSTKN